MPSTRLIDGSTDWSGGVDSIKVTTIASPSAPTGLSRNELSWLNNATVRDGGITQRTGFDTVGTVHDGSVLFQGQFMYEPVDDSTPYFIYALSGQIYKVTISPFTITNLTASFPGTAMPVSEPYFYFVQGEQFLVIQAGDYVTLPLFWDGATLRRSHGITGNLAGPNINEVPAAGPMDYYMGRIWYAQQRIYCAGDIVKNTASGTLAYQFTDSILKVTENPLALGGDGFAVPTQSGTIRALKHNANLDSTTGQGNLFVFTQRAIYSLQVPVTRANWIAATASNQPLQTVVQLVNGSVNDRGVVAVNGDLFFQSLEPGIRSLFSAVRYFGQWGNRQISANEQRILDFVDRSLLKYATGVVFDNRLLQSSLPKQLPQGVVHQALIPLDFIPISEFESEAKPVWEGMYEGLDILQLSAGNFGGLERAFATVVSRTDHSIQLWELTDFERFENGQRADGGDRVTWQIEFPAFNHAQPFELKDLVSMELWVDKLFGTVDIQAEWRPDGDPCWYFWTKFRMCTARNSAEDVNNPTTYPIVGYRESFRSTVTLPLPPVVCETTSMRPASIGYQFQARLTIKGWCRIRGMLLVMNPVERKVYENLTCSIEFMNQNQAMLPITVPPPSSVVVIADPKGNLLADPHGNVIKGF